MARSIKCPHCGQVMKVIGQASGKRVDCPACKKAFRTPKIAAEPDKPTELAHPPPATTPTRVWYVHVEGRNDGPHSADAVVEQVKTGRLDAHTLVWKEGMGDWQPLREVAEFHGALASPPPAPRLRARARRAPEREAEHEQYPHYSRGKAKRDLTLGLWVAGGLGFAALVALFVVLNRKEEKPAWKPPPIVAPPTQPQPYPSTVATVEPKGTPTPPPKKAPRPEASNQKLLAALAADLDVGFRAAIEGHKKAHANPILALIRKCKTHADKLAARDWGVYKDPVDSLVKRLNDASTGMHETLKERSVAWGVGDGVDDKMKAEILELNKFEWITNWQKILADEVEKVRKKGLDF
ncbi:MAG TPA: GYF domain-containing protein [Planctomycetota bacterium]|nr:GYF domain-containing protein [Planctomycetota bacterium]